MNLPYLSEIVYNSSLSSIKKILEFGKKLSQYKMCIY